MSVKTKYPLFFLVIVISLCAQGCFGKGKTNIENIRNYLDSIDTLSANFIQISPDGKVETGKLLLKKPDKIRFEYDLPSNHLVLASGLLLVIIDRKSNSEPQRYLTSQTPLELLLGKNKAFQNSPQTQRSFLEGTKFHVIFNDQENPKLGELELIFSTAPIKLIELNTKDYSGQKTRILLEDISANILVRDELFNIGAEVSNFKRSIVPD